MSAQDDITTRTHLARLEERVGAVRDQAERSSKASADRFRAHTDEDGRRFDAVEKAIDEVKTAVDEVREALTKNRVAVAMLSGGLAFLGALAGHFLGGQ